MKKTKYYKLVQSFTVAEKEKFRQFVYSPYFNKRQQLRDLYELVEAHTGESDFGKVDLWKALFPKKQQATPLSGPAAEKKADKHIRKLLSDLAKLAEAFLEVEGLKKDEWGKFKYLQSELENHELDNYVELNRQSLLNSLKNKPVLPLTQFELERDYYRFLIGQNKRPKDINLEEILQTLEIAYLVNKFKYACETLVYYRMVNMEKEPPKIHFDPAHLPTDNPLLNGYYSLYQLLVVQPGKAEQKQLFIDIRKQLSEQGHLIPTIERESLYNTLQNYCVYQLNQGVNREFYLQRVYEFSKDRMMTAAQIGPISFKNVIRFALALKKMDEAEQLVELHSEKIAIEFREEAIHYNLAQIHFRRKDYSQCRKYISRLYLSDNYYAQDARTLEWKSWVESGEADSREYAITKINNNIRYLNRNTTTPHRRKVPLLNRLKLAKRILLGRTKKEKLREQINSTPQLIDRAYLNSMLDRF